MAIFHLNVKTYSRGKGHSALKVMAKRSRSKLKDDHLGLIYDQSKNKKGLIFSEIMLPDEAPEWMMDREKLWNAVESSEKRKDSLLIREILVALPLELKLNQVISLMRAYCKEAFVKKGMVADFFIYDRGKNPISFVMLTTRGLTKEGFGLKNREWNKRAFLLEWRKLWAKWQNAHLAKLGLKITVDHRSYEERGIQRLPHAHKGAAFWIEKRDPEKAQKLNIIKRNKKIAEFNKTLLTS